MGVGAGLCGGHCQLQGLSPPHPVLEVSACVRSSYTGQLGAHMNSKTVREGELEALKAWQDSCRGQGCLKEGGGWGLGL